MATVSFIDMAALLTIFAKASFEGAKIVILFAMDRDPSNCWFAETRVVRFDRSGEPIRAAVRFIVCAEAVAARAATERILQYMVCNV